MKIVKIDKMPKETVESQVFTGAVQRRSPVNDTENQYSIDYIDFPAGVRNKWHTHSNDQVLIVTKGKGVVATQADGEVEVQEGDVVISPAGEKHWHGAGPDSEFSHISITDGHTELKLAD